MLSQSGIAIDPANPKVTLQMPADFSFGLLCFVSLFAVVEPLGTMPVFMALTADMEPKESRSVALRAVFIAWVLLLVFTFLGQAIFSLFGINVNSLKVVGGVIFFIIGYEMLQARLTSTAYAQVTPQEYGRDIALTPLGIPMIAGPGAIANVMILWTQADTFGRQVAMLLGMTAVMLLTALVLVGSRRVARIIGEGGNKVLLRLMGLITMVIAVEFFFGGLKPIVRDILAIPQDAGG